MKSFTYALGAAVVVIIVASGVWFVMHRDDDRSAVTVEEGTLTATSSQAAGGTQKANTVTQITSANTKYSATITYTSKGFSPAVVHIKAGQVVHFVNKSSLSMRVYPLGQATIPSASLDQQKVVGFNGTFDFLFNSPGTFSYYNMVGNASLTGIIIVDPQ